SAQAGHGGAGRRPGRARSAQPGRRLEVRAEVRTDLTGGFAMPTTETTSRPSAREGKQGSAPAEGKASAFTSGRVVVLEDGPCERLTVCNPDGGVELAVPVPADGPVLSFPSAAFNLAPPCRASLGRAPLQRH